MKQHQFFLKLRIGKLILFTAIFSTGIFSEKAISQTQFYWRSDGGLTGDWNNGQTWWNGGPSAAGFGQLNFDNNSHTTMTMNSSISTWRIFFAAAAGNARTATGTGTVTLYDYGTQVPVIRNESSATMTLNQNFSVGNKWSNTQSDNRVEIVAVNGNLSFGGQWTTANEDNKARELRIDSATSRTVTLSGTITQANANNALQLRKVNSGLLILGGNNAYTGVTLVEAGVLQITHNSALGSAAAGTTVTSGAVVEISGSLGTISEGITLNGAGISDQGVLRNLSGNSIWSGAITLNSGSRINSDTANNTLTLSGGISGGSNILYVGGAGNTTISTIALTGDGATHGSTVTSLYKDGTGTLTLTANNTYSGDTKIIEGALTVNSGGNLGNGNSDVFISSGATLNVNANTTVDSIQETGNNNGGVIAIGSGATLTVDGANKGTFYQNSISGAGNLTVAGSGTTSLALYGAQSYTGNTTVSGGKLTSGVGLATAGVTVSGGTFETTADNILNSSSKNVTVNSGTYDVKGSDSIGRLSGTGGTTTIASAKTLTANYGANASYAGTISGSGTFQKSGASTLTLASGASATVSTIAIQQGTLLLGAANQIGDSTGITMAGGTLNTAGNGDTVGRLKITAESTILGLNTVAGGGSNFIFSSGVDLSDYGTSSGANLIFRPGASTAYSEGNVIRLSTSNFTSWLGYSETSLNNFQSKVQFGGTTGMQGAISFDGTYTTLTVAAIPDARVYSAAAFLLVLIGLTEYRRRRKTVSSKG